MQKINALIKKLSWQSDALKQQIRTIQDLISNYQQQKEQLEKTIETACQNTRQIHPEKEMSRLSFTLKTQGDCEKIMNICREQEMELTRLQNQEIRIKTELRLLEKYQMQQQKKEQAEMLKEENRILDEWALQQKGKRSGNGVNLSRCPSSRAQRGIS